MDFVSFSLLFLQACISALLTCGGAWLILCVARRRWSGLNARRTPWLLAQLVGAVTLALALLPAAPHWSPVAAVPLAAPASWLGTGQQVDGSPDQVPHDLAGGALPAALASLWLALYGAGVLWHALRWMRARRDLSTLLRAAQRLNASDLAGHPALALHGAPLPPVLEIDAPVSPLLAGVLQPVLLLPRHVRNLPPAQQQLIVAHELMHLRRRDHWWQHAGQLLRMLLWFVPPVHGLYRRLQWAVETGCDRAVLAGRAPSERRSYAAALVAQLTLQLRAGEAALSFGAQPLADRIRLIRAGESVPPARHASIVVILLLPALCGASVLLQPRLVLQDGMLPPHAPSAALAAIAPAWQAPLEQMHINSAFGATNRPGGKPHGDIDLRARRGSAVMAPAAGRVAISTDQYGGGARYGKVIAIDHADGSRSLYAHLDGRLVQAGDTVRAGQQIGRSGATGKVTGPHLHVEVSRNGANIDPLALLQRP